MRRLIPGALIGLVLLGVIVQPSGSVYSWNVGEADYSSYEGQERRLARAKQTQRQFRLPESLITFSYSDDGGAERDRAAPCEDEEAVNAHTVFGLRISQIVHSCGEREVDFR